MLSLAGKVPRVLVTPTDDLGVVLNAVHGISMEGTVNFPTGVQVRQAANVSRQSRGRRYAQIQIHKDTFHSMGFSPNLAK